VLAFCCQDCSELASDLLYLCKNKTILSVYLVLTKTYQHPCWWRKLVCFLFPYRENAGLLALTRVGSRRVVQISAGFMIFFSILGELKLESLSATSFITWVSYFLSLVHFFLSTLTIFSLLCRKIWSSIRIHSPSHCCSTILLVLCLCWYVWYNI
jgi:hypothetical protein